MINLCQTLGIWIDVIYWLHSPQANSQNLLLIPNSLKSLDNLRDDLNPESIYSTKPRLNDRNISKRHIATLRATDHMLRAFGYPVAMRCGNWSFLAQILTIFKPEPTTNSIPQRVTRGWSNVATCCAQQ